MKTRLAPLFVVSLAASFACGCDNSRPELVVASFNAWGAGANTDSSIDATVAALKAIDADVVALQEVRAEAVDCSAADCDASGESRASALADALGYALYEQPDGGDAGWANAILTRYPVVDRVAGGMGAVLRVDGTDVAVMNVHLTDYPYQPYQASGIEYGDAPFLSDSAEIAAAADAARGAAVNRMLDVIATSEDYEIWILCGDFNEPSHLDWTARAAASGLHPFAVDFPASRKLESAGFVDAYRAAHADEVEKPGFTWTPAAPRNDPDEHHDRIDFVYLRGDRVEVLDARIAGEASDAADIVVADWPSDHRAVVVTARF